MTTAVTTRSEEPIERTIAAMEDKFAAALPAHIPPQRFVRTTISALANPMLSRVRDTPAGRKSIYDACLKAASDGLLLDGREAALVAYRQKSGDEWIDVAQYMPMVAGIMKKARNSGEIASLVCQVVYANDLFEIDYVSAEAPITHRPDLANRGEMMGVYAVARFKDGSWSQPEYMSVEQVQAIRKRSRAAEKGPWVTDFAEMARKTVIRRLSKYLPSSTDKDGFSEVVRRDDDLYAQDDAPTLQAVAAPAKKSAAAVLAAPAVVEVAHDADTGEVADGDDV